MDTTLAADALMAQRNTRITETISRERGRLGDFIRRRVPDPSEAEDILQDVFFEFVEAYRLPEPIEQIGAWLYRVARNRIIDRFRKRKEQPLPQTADADDEDWLGLALPDPEGGPEAAYLRSVLLTEITRALDELPKAQRDVFIAHELEGRSFKSLAAESGVAVNTLLSRKRHAVLHLRARLQSIYKEFDR
jgi:RNA polymerase sigma factor (sigma-70 family)